MSATSTVKVKVPATTANLGSGFDCLGAALTLYNQFRFSLSTREVLQIIATGAEADRVSTDASNLVYQSFTKLYEHLGKTPPPVQIEIAMDVPLARGLGSSATAIVAGLLGANRLAGSPLSPEEVLHLAIALEGHPDNVVPALMGGCQLAASGIDRDWEICDIPWDRSVVPIVAIPNFELSTAEARRVLPNHYTRADAIFNASHLGLLLRGLETGRSDWLRSALQDRIHQPYRQALIQGYESVQSAALNAGAHGMVISGAGPTLLALADSASAEAVRSAMSSAWAGQEVDAQVKLLQIDRQGAIVE
ncbi:homoserine kinase [Phormidesmis priestleyi ULC007]|uniref:Homoserine kinase n=1 Tax=Phormidesmis priestleyi ULC007 TaxID=1920490 RepID=A0A2T1DA01_9CYAN|nr:homoserine kinase [Phormidesmis priestleyi]PSB17328.1 homoserine kinase [Phormidesmis priestleyi ULC007]PZO48318.1 MAG: homoserine kinase [Phormidesmis priestleyi]